MRTSTAVDEPSRALNGQTMRGLMWMGFSTVVQSVLQVVVLSMLARLLTPSDFGMVAAAMVTIALANTLAVIGIGPAVIQRAVLTEHHIRTAFTLSVLLGMTFCALMWFGAPLIETLFRMTGLMPVMRVLGLVFLVHGFSVVAESLLSRQLRFRAIARIELLSFVVGQGVVAVPLAIMGWSYWALVAAILVQTLITTSASVMITRHPCRPSLNLVALRELAILGAGFSMARMSNYVAVQGDNFVVGRLLGAQALGLYSRAYQLMALPASLYGKVADKVVFPAMAQVQDHPLRLAAAYRRGVGLTALIFMPLGTVIVVLAPELVYILLGPQWTDLLTPFRILAVGMYFRFGYKVSMSLLRSKGRVYQHAYLQSIYAVLVCAGAWLACPYGLAAVSMAVVAALTVHFFLMTMSSLYLLHLTWRDFVQAHLHGTILSIAIGVVLWGGAEILRAYTHPFVTCLIAGALVAIGLLTASRYAPGWFFGQQGMWLIGTLSHYAARWMKPSLHKA